MSTGKTLNRSLCAHCGEACDTGRITWHRLHFCCDGCKMVYQLLDKSGLCAYYDLNQHPGINPGETGSFSKFAILDDTRVSEKLISYADEEHTNVTFYLPQIHCSSCLFLLENLWKLNKGIVSSRIDFSRKEISLVFRNRQISLRKVAELLAHIGYEPYISLNDLNRKKPVNPPGLIFKLGVAGFCFANIMLLSFPEYLGLEASERYLQSVFRYLSLALSLPVFFFSAYPFFESGWKALRSKFLNVDAPIALAILVTFTRSVYEIISSTGSGYLDSMSGIVFFMLVGRVIQERTYRHLAFDRDFTSYFPVAVSVVTGGEEMPTRLPDIKAGDTLRIHAEELIPADGIVTRGQALIDYSFVTGESIPVVREMGEIVYAGGRQKAGAMEILVVKEVSQSYLTRLWSREEISARDRANEKSFVQLLGRYFTYIVLSIALSAAVYWFVTDRDRMFDAVTAVLIVACPCALLLSNTFTNGAILSILGKKNLYLRSAQVIEDIGQTTHIVFDKTGTLTQSGMLDISYSGKKLTDHDLVAIAALASQSSHPLSRAVFGYTRQNRLPEVKGFREVPGKGTEAYIDGALVGLGSAKFLSGKENRDEPTSVYVAFDEKVVGRFVVRNHFRAAIPEMLRELSGRFRLSVISGDNEREMTKLRTITHGTAALRLNMSPEDKLDYIKELQKNGEHVMMIGDGLNDAGALHQSNAGIALTEANNNFTPASDGILESSRLSILGKFISLCKMNRKIVIASFALSLLYNIIGLSFAVQGTLSPLIAAILMPASSISIMLLTFGASHLSAKTLRI